jgi:hypothetical protein
VHAGKRYPEGLQIWPEAELERIIKEQRVDRCLLSYSDLAHSRVMALAARCLAGTQPEAGLPLRRGVGCVQRATCSTTCSK